MAMAKSNPYRLEAREILLMFDTWLQNVEKKYEVVISIEEGDNSFIAKTYTFTDPRGQGLGFKISLDDKLSPSIFDCIEFPFNRFNKAENVSPEDILEAASRCLTGELLFKKSFFNNKYKIEFNLPTFSGHSRPVDFYKTRTSEYLRYRTR